MKYSIHMDTLGEFILMRDKIEIAVLDIAPGKTLEDARQMVADLNSAEATRRMLCEAQAEVAALRDAIGALKDIVDGRRHDPERIAAIINGALRTKEEKP